MKRFLQQFFAGGESGSGESQNLTDKGNLNFVTETMERSGARDAEFVVIDTSAPRGLVDDDPLVAAR